MLGVLVMACVELEPVRRVELVWLDVQKEFPLAKLRLAALALGITLGVGASWMGFWGVAAEDNSPPIVVRHRHYKLAEDGTKTYVGPNFCDNAATDQGFAAFHQNVHIAVIGLDNVLGEPCG
jgi:hypothetical protein